MPQHPIPHPMLHKLLRTHQLHAPHRRIHKKIPLHNLRFMPHILCAHKRNQSIAIQISHYTPPLLAEHLHQLPLNRAKAPSRNNNINISALVPIRQHRIIPQHRILRPPIQERKNSYYMIFQRHITIYTIYINILHN